MLSAIVLRVVMLCYHTERCYVEYRTKYCYFVLSVAMLSVVILSVVAGCYYTECCYAGCYYTMFSYIESCNAVLLY